MSQVGNIVRTIINFIGRRAESIVNKGNITVISSVLK